MEKFLTGDILKNILLILTIIISASCGSKNGCTDPASLTYDSKAKIDDESCTYPDFRLTPTEITNLQKKFIETSALQYTNNRIWTIVDDKSNAIYSIDTSTGNIKEEIELVKTVNTDFEALAENEQYFFVGDIGNNEGNRTDLVIHRVPKINEASLESSNKVNAEQIYFTYEDQSDFQKSDKTLFNSEALIYNNNKLYVFTKSHDDFQSRIYEIPSVPGKHVAKLKGIFNVKGLITDADINAEGNKIVLTAIDGSRSKSFLWILRDFNNSQFYNGKKTIVELGPYTEIGQIEGVAFVNSDSILISNEQDGSILSRLYGLNIGGVK
jgi:hypothetical protein